MSGRRPTIKKPNNPKKGKVDMSEVIKEELSANRQLGERMLSFLEKFLSSSMEKGVSEDKPSSDNSN